MVYSLVEGKQLSLALDSRTRNFIDALFFYKDKDGTEYVTFQNRGKNEILFYNLATADLAFKVCPLIEGENGVGKFFGYYIHNLDSIFLTSSGYPVLAVVNKDAKLVTKIDYTTTTDSIPLEDFSSTSALYQPLIMIGRKMYVISECNRWAKQNPVGAVIDLDTRDVRALPMSYPVYPGMNKMKRYSIEQSKSRCFDGTHFIYSFYYEENIKVTRPDHQSVREVNVKSKYIDKIKLLDDWNATLESSCENPTYGNLIYDEYRKVYYRVAYPKAEISKDISPLELLMYGRKNFSIIILDKDFNVIGETLFPDYTYNSKLMFINKDGLYISDSHYLNPHFSDDVLSFKCFTLQKNKKGTI